MSGRTPTPYLVHDATSDGSGMQSSRTPAIPDSHGKAPLLSDMLRSLGKPGGATASETMTAAAAASRGLGTSPTGDVSANASAAEGSELTIQTLYEGPPKCKCCINWVEEYPDDLRMDVEQQEQAKQKALVVRMRKNHGEGKSLILDSVLVQSQSLKTTLARVFEGYQGITPSLKKLVFRAPFHPFHYRWERFRQVLDEEKTEDAEASSYSQLLFDVLDAELRDLRGEIADMLGNGVMTYSLLWSLFEPGERVMARVGKHWRFFVTKESGFNDKGIFQVQGQYVDWDGSKFGYTTGTMQICTFDGTRPVTELEVYPAKFHMAIEDTESEVIARGKRFRDLRGFHHMAYSGTAQYKDSWGRSVGCNVSGSSIISLFSPLFSPLFYIKVTPSVYQWLTSLRRMDASSSTLRRTTMPNLTRSAFSWPLTPQPSYPISASRIVNTCRMNMVGIDVAPAR